MNRVRPITRQSRAKFWLTSSAAALAALTLHPQSALAQTQLPSGTLLFQTSGPAKCANNGDWYTTNGNATTTPGGVQNGPAGLCFPTDPAGNQTNNPISNRLHKFLINITPDDLAAAGGTVTISIIGAGTGEPITGPPLLLDEVDGDVVGGSGAATNNFDPTRFQLLDTSGTIIDSRTLTPFTNPADRGATIQFVPITQPGTYTVTSVTGEYPINGFTGPFNPQFNNDDNGFRIVVNGASNLLIGQFQGSFQNPPTPLTPQTYDFYFLVGPGTNNVLIRDFDLDNEGGASTYSSPTNPSSTLANSGNGTWNNDALNGGGTLATVGGTADAGRWGIRLNPYGGFNNQTILEVQNGATADPSNPKLPVLDTPPTRAGNFTITKSEQGSTQIGQQICYAVTVTNLFFTTDIINLSLSGTDSNFTVQYFADAAGTTALPDTDGNGVVDTGILQPLGGSRVVYLCVTPKAGTPPTTVDNTTVSGISFMDNRVRQQALQEGRITAAQAVPAPQTILKTTRIGAASGGNSSFRIVKRITNVTRNGATIAGVNFGAIVDDPNDTNDNAAGFSQIPLTGVLALDTTNPVRSGDEVTYTVYFLSDGGSPAIDSNICDLIPGGMTYILQSLEVKLASSSPQSVGTFYTPLAPLPANNSCTIQDNPNGAAIVELGDVSNNAGSNFGFIRFRVRVN